MILYVHTLLKLPWKPCIFFIVQKSLSLRTKILYISWVPMKCVQMNNSLPIKFVLGCNVGKISSRGR